MRLAGAEAELEERRAGLVECQEMVEELQALAEERQREVAALQAQLQVEQDKVAAAEQEVRDLQGQTQAVQEQQRDTQQRLAEAQASQSSQAAEQQRLASEHAQLQLDFRTLKGQLAAAKDASAQSLDRVEALAAQLARVSQDQATAEEQAGTLRHTLEECRRNAALRISSLAAEVTGEARRRAEAEARVDEFYRAHTAAQATAQEQHETLLAQLHAQERAIRGLVARQPAYSPQLTQQVLASLHHQAQQAQQRADWGMERTPASSFTLSLNHDQENLGVNMEADRQPEQASRQFRPALQPLALPTAREPAAATASAPAKLKHMHFNALFGMAKDALSKGSPTRSLRGRGSLTSSPSAPTRPLFRTLAQRPLQANAPHQPSHSDCLPAASAASSPQASPDSPDMWAEVPLADDVC
ncbi:hypothetical protein WJX72_001991 [[Myrmecia] bisecta]|uniref:Uncharacterized protein n=1 Tax=[Myrmecia] bisecta TaxID=41462 RepID=A0AAW1PF42_9CHLO